QCSVGAVVETAVELEHPGDGCYGVPIQQRVSDEIARRHAARDRNEVAQLELATGLHFQRLQHIGNGHALHRVRGEMPLSAECRLEVHPEDGWMAEAELDDGTDLVLIDASLDCRHQDAAYVRLHPPVERAQLFLDHIWASA